MIDRNTVDIRATYGSEWDAYNRLAARAIADVLDDEEVAAVMLDRFDAPRQHKVEAPLRRSVNNDKGRLAVVGVQQVTSAAIEGLQLVDLCLGAVAYQVRETHAPVGGAGPRATLSRQVMQEHYQQIAYVKQGPGRLSINHLTITVFPLPQRGRGRRGGRRRPPASRPY